VRRRAGRAAVRCAARARARGGNIIRMAAGKRRRRRAARGGYASLGGRPIVNFSDFHDPWVVNGAPPS
jgi:hypothetical protein